MKNVLHEIVLKKKNLYDYYDKKMSIRLQYISLYFDYKIVAIYKKDNINEYFENKFISII